MTKLELQQKFPILVAHLIAYIYSLGYKMTFGETWRPFETARIYAAAGKGISKSLHCDRLAIDINLFRGEEYLTDTELYKLAGEYWEALGTDEYKTCWGGRFKRPDGCHFSIAFEGRK